MKRKKIYCMFLIIVLLSLGCSNPSTSMNKNLSITQIGSALEEVNSHYNTTTSIKNDKIIINNRVEFYNNTTEQTIQLILKESGEVNVEIESDNFNKDILMSSNTQQLLIDVKHLNDLDIGSTNNYLDNMESYITKDKNNVFFINFDSNLNLLVEPNMYELTKHTALIYLHFKKNVDNLQKDIYNLKNQSKLSEQTLNLFLTLFIDHPDISLNSFANKDILEVYSILLFSLKKLDREINELDFSHGIYYYNIINTLSNLVNIVNSPLLEGAKLNG